MSDPSPLLGHEPLGAPPWPTGDPFLFCVHHRDDYPPGDEGLGLAPAQLAGRPLGADFSGREGWSMYHGERVPGFPAHPHRGFETVTLARRGFIDHSDSLGATARFGRGDAQWMTAGAGVVHCEMFPLLEAGARNPTELFQIWLNLPARAKLSPPCFRMFWGEEIPAWRAEGVEARVLAGGGLGVEGPAPPPDSWAADPSHQVAIATFTCEPGARWTLPAAAPGLERSLYVFAGELSLAGVTLGGRRARLRSQVAAPLEAGPAGAELLLLQGRPIGEPVVQRGPFVMNDAAGLWATLRDYQETGFGGWPWGRSDPVHRRDAGRFALLPSGERITPPG